MSEFKNKSITTKGMELLSKALAGEILEFTKVELGSGNFTGDIGEATELIQLKHSLPITKISRKGSQVTLSTTLKIEDITTSFDWSELGVYAKGKDGVEILYMYGHTENTSYISRDSLNEKLIHVTVMVSNVAEVTAKIDSSLVYLTDEALKEHGVDQEAHSDIRDKVDELEGQLNNIDISWEGINGKPTTFPPATHTHNYAAATHTHNYLPNPSAGMVSEMGQYIDFHKSGSNADYDARIYVDSNSNLRVLSGGYDHDINYEISSLKARLNAMSGYYKMSNTVRNQGPWVQMAGSSVMKLNSFVATKDGTISIKIVSTGGLSGNYYVNLIGIGAETSNYSNNKRLSGMAKQSMIDVFNLPNGTAIDSSYGKQIMIVNEINGKDSTDYATITVRKGDCLVVVAHGSNKRIQANFCYDEVI